MIHANNVYHVHVHAHFDSLGKPQPQQTVRQLTNALQSAVIGARIGWHASRALSRTGTAFLDGTAG